jgi:alkylation response protein AidB-like acyl-CoA dehydrogenase
MNFTPDADQELLRDSIRRFMKTEVAPLVAKHDVEKTFPFELMKELAQFGYIGGRLSEAEGGMGLDQLTWAMLMEEAGYTWLSLRTILNITNGPIHKLATEGTAAQKERFLKPLLASDRSVFTAISEPGTGSNIAQVQTRADLQGDHYVLNGRKLWITNGAFADFGIVVARTFSPDCQGQLSTFLVEREVSPFESRRVDTMVLRSTGTAELSFDNVKVPRENLLGEEGSALKRMLVGLDAARVNIAMGAVGAARSALELSIDYARTRTQFGKPIGSFQLVQKLIVDMTVRVEAARALALRAASALDANQSDARMACSIAKLYATEAAHEVASMALQVHGGLGYSTDYPIERIFRDTRGGTIPEGTTEVQTLIVGREILGMSAIA